MDDGLTVDLIHANPDGAFNTIRALEAENERLRRENFELVDAMRDARALLHRVRPEAMAAATRLGNALEDRTLAALPTSDITERSHE